MPRGGIALKRQLRQARRLDRAAVHVGFEAFQPRERARRLFIKDFQNRAERAHAGGVSRNNQFALFQFENVLKRLHDAFIPRDAAMKRYRLFKRFPLAEIAFVIPRHRVAQARHDVVIRRGDLLQMNHVRFGEDRAASGDARRMRGF